VDGRSASSSPQRPHLASPAQFIDLFARLVGTVSVLLAAPCPGFLAAARLRGTHPFGRSPRSPCHFVRGTESSAPGLAYGLSSPCYHLTPSPPLPYSTKSVWWLSGSHGYQGKSRSRSPGPVADAGIRTCDPRLTTWGCLHTDCASFAADIVPNLLWILPCGPASCLIHAEPHCCCPVVCSLLSSRSALAQETAVPDSCPLGPTLNL
jgi:hypothetical protein